MTMESSDPEVTSLLQRHTAFWQMEDVDKPLMRTREYRALEDVEIRIPLADGRMAAEGEELTSEKIDPRRFIETRQWRYSRQRDAYEEPLLVSGDFLTCRAPFDLCWTEAIVGCRVYFSSRSRWAEPVLSDWSQVHDVRPDEGWMSVLLEYIRALQESSEGRYLVCNPLMRRPIDMAAALVGDAALAMAIFEHPDEFEALLRVCTDVNIEIHRRIWEIIPQVVNGWCTSFGIWAPGTVGYTQIDASELFSPSQFREFIQPHYARLFGSRDYVTIHTHSVSHRHVDALLDMEDLRVVQIAIDPPAFGPSVAELMPVFHRVQQVKPLVVSGPVTEDELALMLDSLSPNGLALMLGVIGENSRQAPELVND